MSRPRRSRITRSSSPTIRERRWRARRASPRTTRVFATRRTRIAVGVALSIRAALGRARGKYIAILNDDDVWEPGLSRAARAAARSGCEPSARVLRSRDHGRRRTDRRSCDRSQHQPVRAIGPSRRGHRRSEGVRAAATTAFRLRWERCFERQRFRPSVSCRDVAGAYDFWISSLLAASGGAFYYVPARLTRYRVHAGDGNGEARSRKNAVSRVHCAIVARRARVRRSARRI